MRRGHVEAQPVEHGQRLFQVRAGFRVIVVVCHEGFAMEPEKNLSQYVVCATSSIRRAW